MEQIAVISDIHGNMPALEATLNDIKRRGIRRIFCLGDLVGKGPHSERAVDICRAECEITVRGNWDEFIVRPTDEPLFQWHQARLGPERMEYLAQLPGTIDFVMSGRNVRLFHASQVGIFHRVLMDAPWDALEAMFTNTEFTGDGVEPDVVGYGDIHWTYLKTLGKQILFNVGSVGNPLEMTLASYAILEGDYSSAEPGPFAIQLIRLPYDIELAVRQAQEEGMADWEVYADELRTARYRGLTRTVDSSQ